MWSSDRRAPIGSHGFSSLEAFRADGSSVVHKRLPDQALENRQFLHLQRQQNKLDFK